MIVIVGLRQTGYGRLVYAVGDNPEAARLGLGGGGLRRQPPLLCFLLLHLGFSQLRAVLDVDLALGFVGPGQSLALLRELLGGDDSNHAAAVDLLLSHQLLGELQHRDGLRQRALVETLDPRLHHLLEALAALGGVVRVADDAAHLQAARAAWWMIGYLPGGM